MRSTRKQNFPTDAKGFPFPRPQDSRADFQLMSSEFTRERWRRIILSKLSTLQSKRPRDPIKCDNVEHHRKKWKRSQSEKLSTQNRATTWSKQLILMKHLSILTNVLGEAVKDWRGEWKIAGLCRKAPRLIYCFSRARIVTLEFSEEFSREFRVADERIQINKN